jgi:hypothetical protein
MKNNIVERLLNEGHITIKIADVLINNGTNKVEYITDLKNTGIITNMEAITLLRNDETLSFPFGVPNHSNPIMPLTYPMPFIDINTPYPFRPWTVTCTGTADPLTMNQTHTEK